MGVIEREIGGVFIPVRDIEAARDWYCGLVGLEPDGEIAFGHIYVVRMKAGSGLILDSKDFKGPHDRKPVFHFTTSDIHAAHAWLKAYGAEIVGGITDGVFVNFKDPDGNLLMVADVKPAPKY